MAAGLGPGGIRAYLDKGLQDQVQAARVDSPRHALLGQARPHQPGQLLPQARIQAVRLRGCQLDRDSGRLQPCTGNPSPELPEC